MPLPRAVSGTRCLTLSPVLMTHNTDSRSLTSGPWADVVLAPSCRPAGVLWCCGAAPGTAPSRALACCLFKICRLCSSLVLGYLALGPMCPSAVAVPVPVRDTLSPRVTSTFLWTLSSSSSFFSNFRVSNL